MILFLLFILLAREDLRDRFLRLLGTADLQRSTAALDDAGSRLSRFFLMQTLLNTGFGVVIGIGLWLIGVPNAALWGFLRALCDLCRLSGAWLRLSSPLRLQPRSIRAGPWCCSPPACSSLPNPWRDM